MSATTIRRATPADAETVQLMLLELADHEVLGQHVHIDVARWRELLAEPEVFVLVAEQDGEAVGYVSAVRRLDLWQGRDLLALDDLYVRASVRSQGVGGLLMGALASLAHEDRLLIVWGLRTENHAARRFYERLGASVHEKSVASWPPHEYAARLAPLAAPVAGA